MDTYTSSSPREKTRHPLSTVARRRKSTTRRNPEKTAALNFHARLPPPSTYHVDVRQAALEGDGDSKSVSSSSNGLDPSSSFSTCDESKISSDEFSGFVDEEAMFNMPLVVDSMADGMLLTPPALKKGFSWTQGTDDLEIGYTLWNDC